MGFIRREGRIVWYFTQPRRSDFISLWRPIRRGGAHLEDTMRALSAPRRSGLRVAMTLWVVVGAIFAAIPASAAVVSNLYQATVPASGRGDAARNAAFATALRMVAVRASGLRDAGERLSPATVADARRYVQRFGDNPDGTLQVGFDGDSIDRILAQNDLPVWGRERPLTLVWLSIEDAAGQQSWVGPDVVLPETRVIQQVAALRGLPLVWPVMDMEDRLLAGALGNDEQEATRLAALASRYRADGILVGRARRAATGELTVRWSLHFGETTNATSGSLAEGVQFAADHLSRVFAAAAGSVQDVLVDVTAIDSLQAYAETLNYLEGMTLVRSAAVDHVSGDTVRFRLQVRGDAGLLARAIGLGSRLVPEQGAAALAPGRLALRYQPTSLRR